LSAAGPQDLRRDIHGIAQCNSAGLSDLLVEHLTVGSPNAGVKVGCVIGGMLAGADSIDDLGMLRHGAMARLFGGVRAPSTLGTYLRSFTHGHVQQLDAVSSRLLAGLAAPWLGRFMGYTRPDRPSTSRPAWLTTPPPA
jgi:hypothetical protein